MAQTVIGFFKDAADAQKAVAQLAQKGISGQYVDVSKGEYLDGTADVDGRNTNKFTDLFNKLFGHDSDDAKRYATMGQSNVTLVTVHAPSNDLAEQAADVLDDCGAIDVDEHGTGAAFSEGSGSTFGTGGGTIGLDETNLGGQGTMGTGSPRRRSRIIDQSLGDDFRSSDL
jgi:hypothetical protein